MKTYVTPVKCNCIGDPNCNGLKESSINFLYMKATELRAWVASKQRPDLLCYADCVEANKKLDAAGDECERLDKRYGHRFPQWLQEKFARM